MIRPISFDHINRFALFVLEPHTFCSDCGVRGGRGSAHGIAGRLWCALSGCRSHRRRVHGALARGDADAGGGSCYEQCAAQHATGCKKCCVMNRRPMQFLTEPQMASTPAVLVCWTRSKSYRLLEGILSLRTYRACFQKFLFGESTKHWVWIRPSRYFAKFIDFQFWTALSLEVRKSSAVALFCWERCSSGDGERSRSQLLCN